MCLLVVQYLASDAIAWQIQKRSFDVGPFDDGLFTTAVLHAFGPFHGGIFRPKVIADAVIPWVVGLVVAVVVVWVVIAVVSRKGVLAAFVGGWLAVILGTWAGNLASAMVFIQTSEFPDEEPYSTQILTGAFDHGLHWGFVFGWFPALVAALLASVLTKKEATGPEPTRPTHPNEPTGRTGEKGPEPRMM
jgi:hypothetical protein